MKDKTPDSSPKLIDISHRDSTLAAEVKHRSGVDINLCWHCQSCASGCPFVSAMDYPPNAVIRLAQLGLRKEALESSGIWICVGCNTCSVQCPNAIDIPAVNDSLRQMAMEEGAKIAEPNILHFHQEVLNSIKRYGRTHKFEIMLRYKLRRKITFHSFICFGTLVLTWLSWMTGIAAAVHRPTASTMNWHFKNY